VIVAVNLYLPQEKKSSTPQKALKTSQLVVQNVVKPIKPREATEELAEANANFTKQFAQIAVWKPRFLSNQTEPDQFTAPIVTKLIGKTNHPGLTGVFFMLRLGS